MAIWYLFGERCCIIIVLAHSEKRFGVHLFTLKGDKKMKKQALAIAIASALVAPSAFAAQDTSGMQYTSAAEGFYASIRAQVGF